MEPSIAAAAASDSQIQQLAMTFGVDWIHLGAQIISFGILCAVLYKFAFRKILFMLETRRTQIAQGLADAEKIRAELESIEIQRRDVMAEAHIKGEEFVHQARTAANEIQEAETRKAIAAAEEIIQKARMAAESEHDRMLSELRAELGRLVAQTTAAVTGKVLTAEDHRRLADETLVQAVAIK